MSLKTKTFEDNEEFVKANINYITEVCNRLESPIYIALSGGITPINTYKELCKEKNINIINTKNLEFFLVDERYVPLSHELSNYRAINNACIKKIKKKIKGFHYFDTSLSIEDSLEKYRDELRQREKDSFDLSILGMGTDGHIGGVFPKRIVYENKTVYHCQTDIFAIKDRLTMSPETIFKSDKILLLIKGQVKQEALNKLLKSNNYERDFPVTILLEHPDVTIHYCKE